MANNFVNVKFNLKQYNDKLSLSWQMSNVPDKSFLSLPRMERFRDSRYEDGIKAFLAFADRNPAKSASGMIHCPCTKCKNEKMFAQNIVYDHLVRFHFDKAYTHWDHHGEGSRLTVRDTAPTVCDTAAPVEQNEDGVGNTRTMIDDVLAGTIDMDTLMDEEMNNPEALSNWKEFEKTMKLIEENEKELYEGCSEFTRLSFIVRLLHFQSVSSLSNVHFDMLLNLLRMVIPNGRKSIPKSHYEATKLVKALDLDYEKIHACPNDCMLYYKENKNLQCCSKCGVSRWRRKKHSIAAVTSDNMFEDKVPAKVLRYFPLTKRLQRFYMTKDIAKNMRWHSEERQKDGKLRHPADFEAWKHLDRVFPNYGREIRNVRLGLASDGFNPFGMSNTGWSTWPVIVMPYNLPPWMCMK